MKDKFEMLLDELYNCPNKNSSTTIHDLIIIITKINNKYDELVKTNRERLCVGYDTEFTIPGNEI